MKAIVTLTEVYKRETKIEIDRELLEGKTAEEVVDFLIQEFEHTSDENIEDVNELEAVSFDEYSLEGVDTNRYDIFDDQGNQIYGGHL